MPDMKRAAIEYLSELASGLKRALDDDMDPDLIASITDELVGAIKLAYALTLITESQVVEITDLVTN